MEVLKVIKIGGNIIDDPHACEQFLKDFSKIKNPKILVHGGGKMATQLAEEMKVDVKMINGRRITDAATLDIITMVYAGKINKNIVAKLQALGSNAIGFSGADGNSVISIKRPVQEVDFGYVGDIQSVNTEALTLLMKNDIIPVFCAITHDNYGQLLNTNADTIASELAISFARNYHTELFYCFEKRGVLKDISDETSVIQTLNSATYKALIANGQIAEGMLPKLNNCFHAVSKDVKHVYIGQPEMLLNSNSIFTTIQK